MLVRCLSRVVIVALCTTALAAAAQEQLPSWTAVEKKVEQYFKSLNDHEPGDLISRDQATAVLDELAGMGWNVADRKEILEAVLAPTDPLVKKLRTKSGRKFMRESDRYPMAYDRLDHLSRLSDGQRIIDRLIAGPDGYKLIEYLATAPGGKNMGKMLSAAPHGAKFNQSTGRIYTQAQLVAKLKQSYEAASRAGAR